MVLLATTASKYYIDIHSYTTVDIGLKRCFCSFFHMCQFLVGYTIIQFQNLFFRYKISFIYNFFN